MAHEALGAKYLVHGRVQGVGFRYSACTVARRLHIHGWIRNNVDGTVEAFAEGSRSSLDRFHEWLMLGPPGAYVSRVDVQKSSATNVYHGFKIEY